MRGRLALTVLMVCLPNAYAFGQRDAVQPAVPSVDEGAAAVAPAQAPTTSRLRRDVERTNLGWLGLLGLPGLAPFIVHEAQSAKSKRR